jgi:metal-dependent amidase/aminoacylase/carboxypeptidase family protein
MGGGRDACGHDGHITPLAHEHLYLANSSDDRPNTLLTVHAYDDRV